MARKILTLMPNSFEKRIPISLENKGETIYGMLHLPLSKEPFPAVLMCHGFAGNKVGRYRIYVILAQQLAKNGIATLRFDFRGSGDSEGDFSQMTIEGEVSDALVGLSTLRQHPQIDPNRIGILGNSFGAIIAVLAAQRDRCVKSLALLAALYSSEAWRKQWELLQGMKTEQAEKELARLLDGNVLGQEFYKQFFSLDLKPALDALSHLPLLHIHSLQDQRVTMDQARQYEQCRQQCAGETRWVRLQKCDHDFSFFEERNLIAEEVTNWFSKTL